MTNEAVESFGQGEGFKAFVHERITKILSSVEAARKAAELKPQNGDLVLSILEKLLAEKGNSDKPASS